ncbi:EcsC family protein [Aestuariimicrobium ganziense]|uniref:EcsC family protein n=1 Tax=Aestuariimicrobium ganziense TaxID=2773677 RepID=UPI001943C379|nr:EcsC family protein [Aestuariimicrobium ganziense]
MGLFDIFRKDEPAATRRSVLDEANDPARSDDIVTNLIEQLVEFGIEGKGPMKSAVQVGDAALKDSNGDVEKAIDKVARDHLKLAAVGGFATGLGGFITMPVALPANIIEFYVTATRMVASIAHLRGHDVNRDEIRTAVLLTLTGTQTDDILRKAGIAPAAGVATNALLKNLPSAALMMINKGVGFRLLRNLGTKAFAKLGKAVPFAGGVVGAGLDGWMINRVADHARREFPTQVRGTTV